MLRKNKYLGEVLLMGILNVTPDSFSDGGRYTTTTTAVKHARQLVDEGASVIDIGGESSRPGAQPISVKKELQRVIPVIKTLRKKSRIPLSIDTYKPAVAEAAIAAGATWVNDITGLRDTKMRQVVAQARCTVVLMHMRGLPQTMQQRPRYRDVVHAIIQFFRKQITLAEQTGIKRQKIILDPGIGFGKTVQHNLEILRRLGEIRQAFPKQPLLIGASHKSFIGKLTGAEVHDRLPGTLVAHLVAVHNGATLLRVHDVAAHRQALALYKQLIPH